MAGTRRGSELKGNAHPRCESYTNNEYLTSNDAQVTDKEDENQEDGIEDDIGLIEKAILGGKAAVKQGIDRSKEIQVRHKSSLAGKEGSFQRKRTDVGESWFTTFPTMLNRF